MKRDLDHIRKLLLEIEEYCEVGKTKKYKHSFDDKNKASTNLSVGHIQLLIDENFIEVIDATDQEKIIFVVRRLTSKGHDYLDSVRDPKIWKATKASLSKVGGSTTLAVVQAVAVTTVKTKLGLS